MELKQMKYFKTIVEEGTITQAARVLHISQPPLSMQLKAIEEELDTILIERGHRHITLTPAGHLFYRRCNQKLNLYEQTRKEKEAKKKQKVIDVKEIRLSPNIDTNDLNTKVNAARKFLSKGDKVKVTLRFRGREMAHMQSSKHILTEFGENLSDVAVVEKEPKVEGRSMTMFLAEKR